MLPHVAKVNFRIQFIKLPALTPTLLTGTVTKVGITVRLLLMYLVVECPSAPNCHITTVKLQFSTVLTV
jgi:hypothetical protein